MADIDVLGGVIYMYTNKVNGKKYVGQTWHEARRRGEHDTSSRSITEGFTFQKALKKYGYDVFDYNILHSHVYDQKTLDDLEVKEIREQGARTPNGYNETDGGRGGRLSPDSIAKLSKSLRDKLGKPVRCIETGEEFSCIVEAADKYDLHAGSLGRCCRGYVSICGGRHWEYIIPGVAPTKLEDCKVFGIYRPVYCVEDQLFFNNASDAAKAVDGDVSCILDCCNGDVITYRMKHWVYHIPGRHLPKIEDLEIGRHKPVYCVETQEIFPNAVEASKRFSKYASSITDCCKGKNNTAFGLHWRYYIPGEPMITLKDPSLKKATKTKVICIETNKKYNSITEAVRDMPFCTNQGISACCAGIQEIHRNYHWKYCEEQ